MYLSSFEIHLLEAVQGLAGNVQNGPRGRPDRVAWDPALAVPAPPDPLDVAARVDWRIDICRMVVENWQRLPYWTVFRGSECGYSELRSLTSDAQREIEAYSGERRPFEIELESTVARYPGESAAREEQFDARLIYADWLNEIEMFAPAHLQRRLGELREFAVLPIWQQVHRSTKLVYALRRVEQSEYRGSAPKWEELAPTGATAGSTNIANFLDLAKPADYAKLVAQLQELPLRHFPSRALAEHAVVELYRFHLRGAFGR